jgi:MMP 1-O-methyltransferase
MQAPLPDGVPESEAFLYEDPNDDHLTPLIAIEGWLHWREGRFLYALAKQQLRRFPHGNMVEIGSWKGKSAAYLATALTEARTGVLWCVDPFWASGQFEAFIRNLGSRQLLWRVCAVQALSMAAARQLAVQNLILLWIDGDHRYQNVVDDFRAWSPRVRCGGVVVFHDYSDTFPEVRQAVNATAGADETWEYIGRRGSAIAFRRICPPALAQVPH